VTKKSALDTCFIPNTPFGKHLHQGLLDDRISDTQPTDLPSDKLNYSCFVEKPTRGFTYGSIAKSVATYGSIVVLVGSLFGYIVPHDKARTAFGVLQSRHADVNCDGGISRQERKGLLERITENPDLTLTASNWRGLSYSSTNKPLSLKKLKGIYNDFNACNAPVCTRGKQ